MLSCIDYFAAPYFNDAEEAWTTFVQMIRLYLCAGAPLTVQQALAHSIESGLFVSLNQQRKIALCDLLLEVGAQDSSAVSLHIFYYINMS